MKPPKRKFRILVVDDNRDAADLYAILIARWGYDVHVAYDGSECIVVAPVFQPHLVLLDIGLPDIDGYEVAKKLAALDFLPRPIIAAISGIVHEEHVARCDKAGIAHRIMKPVTYEALKEFIASVALANWPRQVFSPSTLNENGKPLGKCAEHGAE